MTTGTMMATTFTPPELFESVVELGLAEAEGGRNEEVSVTVVVAPGVVNTVEKGEENVGDGKDDVVENIRGVEANDEVDVRSPRGPVAICVPRSPSCLYRSSVACS